LTQSLAAVNSYYATAIDPKKLAMFALFGVAGKIYAPRIMAFMMRRKIEREARKPRITPLSGAPTSGTPVNPPVPAPQAPQARQTVAPSAVPKGVMDMFSDASFVSDVAEDS
jgi:hypothetical protein